MEFEGFMYLDVRHPIVAWNVFRGVMISQKLVQGPHGSAPALSMTTARLFIDQNYDRFLFELALEAYRLEKCPEKASRLVGMFVFDEPESALLAAEDEAWGGHVDAEFLTDVGVSAAPNLSRMDGNWISWMLQQRAGGGDPDWSSGIAPYWSGTPCPHYSTPIWEVLIEGAITVWDKRMQERAYWVIRNRCPGARTLLELSRLAALQGSDLGHLSAFITNENDRPLLSFHMDFVDAKNPRFTDKLGAYVAANPDLVNFADLAVGGDYFILPDFAMHSYAFY